MDALIDKLHAAWLAADRDNDEFLRRVSQGFSLHEHESYLVQRAGITLSEAVLRAAKALIGEPAFDEILSSLKAAAIEPVAPQPQNPNGLLIYRVCEALRGQHDVLPRPKPVSASGLRALR
jgi:hypothetical protein